MESLLSPRDICATAKTNGYNGVCILDENNLYGTPAFLRLVKNYNLQPINGALLNDGHDIIAALTTSPIGYQNLCTLITNIHRQPDFRLQDQTSLLVDLIFITEQLPIALLFHDKKLPVYWAMHIPCHIPPPEIIQKKIPLLALHLANLLQSTDHNTRILMNSIRKNELLSSKGVTPSRLIYSQEKFIEQFAPFPEALTNNQKLQNKCQYYYKPQVNFPSYTPPQGLSPLDYLRQLTYTGASRRYLEITDAVKARIDYELNIIDSKGFVGYFLVVREIVAQASRTCGRGSGSGSIVSYCLFITNIDPIRYHLLFERFLSPDRVDYPDLDIDFAWDERDDILDFVRQRFGIENCAMVCNHIYYQPKMALRETAKAHGYSDVAIKDFSKTVREIIKKDPQQLSKLETKALLTAKRAIKLIGHPRHISLHCGGVVITPAPIHHFVPLQNSSKGIPVIQWEKDGTEEMGLVKIDLLGNRSLAVIRDAIANCQENGHEIDYCKIDPTIDTATIKMLASGESMGVFYIESPATRLLQRRSTKGDFEHIVIHSSIIRPACNDSMREYTRRVRGGSWLPIHPIYEQITADAYGVMVYEDHVLRVTHEMAGFTYHEANQLRKALSREDTHSLKKLKEKFYQGLAQYELTQSCR
jgi:DNA polymerase-3 subunit alpha/error-prone DNA polymerase